MVAQVEQEKKKRLPDKRIGEEKKKGSKHGRYGMGIVARPEDGRKKRNSTPVCVCVCLISYISFPFFFFFISIIHTNDGGSFNLMKGKSNYTL